VKDDRVYLQHIRTDRLVSDDEKPRLMIGVACSIHP